MRCVKKHKAPMSSTQAKVNRTKGMEPRLQSRIVPIDKQADTGSTASPNLCLLQPQAGSLSMSHDAPLKPVLVLLDFRSPTGSRVKSIIELCFL